MNQEVEHAVRATLEWLELGVEVLGALFVAVGVIVAVSQITQHYARNEPRRFAGIRLSLAQYLALALEFQLAADILATAIAPEWGQIGKLFAIALIRTGLNYFLSKEMKSEREERREPEPERSPA